MAWNSQHSIKRKLQLSFLALLIISSVGALISFQMMHTAQQYQSLQEEVHQITDALHQARRAEQEVLLYDRKTVTFLETGNSQGVQHHQEQMTRLHQQLSELEQRSLIRDLELQATIQNLARQARTYQYTFAELVRKMVLRGFKDHGLEGEMREYVHRLQECESDAERVFAYQLRRHEKDFFLRHETKYVERLDATVDAFIEFVQGQPLPHMTEEYVNKITSGIAAYHRHFHTIATVDKKLGLTEGEGLRGRLQLHAAGVDPFVRQLTNVIGQRSEALKARASWVMGIVFLVVLLASILLTILLSNAISKPIILLDSVVGKIVKGQEGAEVALESVTQKDEIGRLTSNFRTMLAELRKNMAVITEKNNRLEKAKAEDRIRNWRAEGLAQFSDLLKGKENLSHTLDEITSHLVKYLKANQGAFFLKGASIEDPDHEVMQLVSCYAWERHKKSGLEIGYGEGLVGMAWRDGDPLYYTDIPENYINIRSGLGLASPKALLIVPISHEGTIVGMLELASFLAFAPHEQEFVTQLAERIGATIMSVELQERTQVLLHQSQQMTEELQAQEEEMRQNMEELHATQEEMQRNERALRDQIIAIQEQLLLHEAVAQTAGEGLIICNPACDILYVSTSVEELLGIPKEQLVNTSLNLLLTEGTAALLERLENDPSYIINKRSTPKKVLFTDRLGQEHALPVMVVQLPEQQGHALLLEPRGGVTPSIPSPHRNRSGFGEKVR